MTRKNRSSEQLIRFDTAEPIVKNDPTFSVILAQSKRMYNDMGTLIDLIESITLNNVEQRDLLLQLIDVYQKSDKLKDERITQLHTHIQQQEKEIAEFKKHEPHLE